ncbi:MAG: CBS domain-containing protein [Vicinamibacteria bacterium]
MSVGGGKSPESTQSTRDSLVLHGCVRGVLGIRVGEIMTRGPLATAHPETSLRNIAEAIVNRRIGCVPILGAEDQLVGVVTQNDVLAGFLMEQ